MQILTHSRIGNDVKVGIVVAQFNELVTQKLQQGAVSQLEKYGVNSADILVAAVPGALELPRIAKKVANSGKVDGIIALGAVIRGETSHYDYVCAETASGLAQVSLNGPVPVMFGVLTTDNLDQAISRAGGKGGNKGADCADGLIEMINLEKQL
ncbi:6,7-dimethyl-8-ribityllumazine synthase [Secundilactobacillus pentosiphilus]|uniref:6,7-dimethyl-8-ribityllumazine synthase n=1 Tax=Secundilactobacillus pentosiphilus TaxID=1714682 RepID=A0A1Z5IT84_9LACO|nr:6,7-dimethyl-8-ribityllumazine synthase [Secundilactobacillus pentosiphilus]GAX04970.1 6,7-dimethyl-8-ribityllumazine synthase [Secundilactobacillus pentosiphilus]